MLYFTGIDDRTLQKSLNAVSKSVDATRQIGIGRPLKIELMSVQLANLHLEGRGGWSSEEKRPFQPIVVSKCRSGIKDKNGQWKRPELFQLHYDSDLEDNSNFIKKATMDAGKRSTLIHYIPVYEGQRISFTLSIYELDKRMSKETKDAIDGMFDVASAVFLPYSPAIFGAKTLFSVFVKLHDVGQKHDRFLNEEDMIEWNPGSISHRASTCLMICVQEKSPSGKTIQPPFDPNQWKLNEEFRLVDNHQNPLTDRCYAVVHISNELLPLGVGYANSQKAATLLSEIERQQEKSDGHRVVWEELLNTMESYSTGKEIGRILELKAKSSLNQDDKAKLKGYLNIPSVKALPFYDALKKDVNLG